MSFDLTTDYLACAGATIGSVVMIRDFMRDMRRAGNVDPSIYMLATLCGMIGGSVVGGILGKTAPVSLPIIAISYALS